MEYINKKEAVLLLEDGTFFNGYAIGKIGTTGGEICFSTGMTGYQEVYTDPSFYGQIIVNTASHVGNYGVVDAEQESENVMINGLVVNYFSESYSRHMADRSLQAYLEDNNVVGIAGIDTRKLVRYLRDKGAMNAIISSEILDIGILKDKLAKIPSMIGLELSSEVSAKEAYTYGEEGRKVAVLDLGVKRSMLKNLTARGCQLKVFPAKTTFEEMEAWNPEGYVISNGPGDPAATTYAVDTVKKILDADKPMFGICLGHQLLAMANGIGTYKLHHGHRGLNHPVKNLETGKSEITSQNHGFGAKADEIKNSNVVVATHVNLNDGTVEGIRVKDKKAFSVQYHPEASPGPNDSKYLFDNFIALLNK